ncbi:hypothetical protein TgHK011_009013 [Trichoderma gracile]|nr:hypothetical protein TgHK011_009013 [Trichoderma gracile]
MDCRVQTRRGCAANATITYIDTDTSTRSAPASSQIFTDWSLPAHTLVPPSRASSRRRMETGPPPYCSIVYSIGND